MAATTVLPCQFFTPARLVSVDGYTGNQRKKESGQQKSDDYVVVCTPGCSHFSNVRIIGRPF